MIKPLYDNVVVKHEQKENKTASGIVLTTKEDSTEYAVVQAIGDGILSDGTKVHIPFKVGDKVLIKGYSSIKVHDNNEEYKVVSVKDIVAVVE